MDHIKSIFRVKFPCKLVALCVVCYQAFAVYAGKVDPTRCLIWGPGMRSHFNLPVRYFYIQAVDISGNNFTDSVGENAFEVQVLQASGERVRIRVDILDRHDGVYIVRLKPFEAPENIVISILYQGQHVADSPYKVKGPVYQEKCYCPVRNLTKWYQEMNCPSGYQQIENDLAPFSKIDMDVVSLEAVNHFSDKGRHSLCHYKIVNNKDTRITTLMCSKLRQVDIPPYKARNKISKVSVYSQTSKDTSKITSTPVKAQMCISNNNTLKADNSIFWMKAAAMNILS